MNAGLLLYNDNIHTFIIVIILTPIGLFTLMSNEFMIIL